MAIAAIAVLTSRQAARGESFCYLQRTNGQVINLSSLCGVSEKTNLARLDQKFLALLSDTTDEDTLETLNLADRKALPQIARIFCAKLSYGSAFSTLNPLETAPNLPANLLFSIKTAAVGVYCPQFTSALIQGRKKD